jgi:hypothetical protein
VLQNEHNEVPSEDGMLFGPDDDHGSHMVCLDMCECGHTVTEHGADESELGHDEFVRRGLVAIRMDEFLQVQPC